MAQARTRIDSTKPRSGSISDTSKLEAALASLKLGQTPEKSSEVHVQELNGVFLKRIPLVEADFNTNTTIPSYQYHLENKRDYDVRVLMTFTGNNIKSTPANSTFSKVAEHAVEGLIAKSASAAFVLIEAADKSKDFTFNADIKIFPVQDDIKEVELQGVKLFTTITHSGVTATMKFEAQNNKEFDVEIELDLNGQITEKSGSVPFTKVVRAGERAEIGYIKSDAEIETSWRWTALSGDTPNPQKKHVQTSELKGVTLKQSLTPGTPTEIEFDVTNGREKRIRVEIDFSGTGDIDFKGQSRPLTGTVQPGKTSFIGAIQLKGDCEVNWKFREETD